MRDTIADNILARIGERLERCGRKPIKFELFSKHYGLGDAVYDEWFILRVQQTQRDVHRAAFNRAQ